MEKNVPDNANQGCPGVHSENAGKTQTCKGCPNQSLCNSKSFTPDPSLSLIKKKMQCIKHKILVLSGKGGVGKSTTATQLAMALATKGYQVGLLDIDLCGPSIPRMTGLQCHQVHKSNQGWSLVYGQIENLGVMSIGFLLQNKNDAVIWRGPRKNGLIKQFLIDVAWNQLDYLIVDTPPGTSDQHLSIIEYMQIEQKDGGALIITTPQEISLSDVRKEINFCVKTKTRILGVIQNMSGFQCPHCKQKYDIFPSMNGGAEKMCKEFQVTGQDFDES